ncbi:MAG: efflux transporter outer membrane subunit [Bryobacteraceae bacterium]
MIADCARRYSHSASCRALFAACGAALVSSCADFRGPEFQRPETPEKPSWSRPAAAVSASDTITQDWWREFRDPYLSTLVDRAIAGNFDLKVLAARIQVAAAQIGEAQAGALPTVDLGAGAIFERSTGQKTQRRYDLGVQVNWEVDIWGKVEKGVQAQTAEYRASEADWRAGYLTLVAAVLTTYFQIRQFDEQIDQQRRSLATNKTILTIYAAQFAHGLVPQTQVLRQRAELNLLTTDLLELKKSRDLSENALATLTGVPAGELKVPAGHLRDEVRLPGVPAVLPSQLLSRRPDIVAAEYRVLSAYDLVGQARLAQLPSVNLAGRAGTAALSPGDLFRTFTLSFLPSINFPMFDPSIKARIRTTEAQTQFVEQDYRRVVMSAFEEVENALVNLVARKGQQAELLEATDRLQVVATQIEAQLKTGVVSQLEVFETERQVLRAQLALVGVHRQILSDTVTLYKALGGGWPTVNVRNESG